MRPKLAMAVVFLVLAAITAWGYSQYQGKRQWEINAENQYQRAFAELATRSRDMEADISKALVAASFTQTIRLLTNAWREANSCQENLGQLPLTSLELAGTKNLLANVSSFCFNTAQKKLIQGGRITETEWEKLRLLRRRIQLMGRHLSDLQQNFLTTRSRWLDVDRLGSSSVGAVGMPAKAGRNQVTKSFLMLEDGLKRMPDLAHEGNNLFFSPKPTGLTGKNVSIKEAERIARRFLLPDYPGVQVKYERMIRGEFPCYMMKATPADRTAPELRCSVSLRGGHVAWVLGNRNVNRAKWGLDRCAAKADRFLTRQGYPNMQVVARESYDNIATLTYAAYRGETLYYPELVKVQVARDNGAILGSDFIPYLTFHDPHRPRPSRPAYTTGQIRKRLNPHFKPEQIRRTEVLDEMYNKVPCYEVSGRQGADRYLIYYNANTAREEKIRRVDRNGNELL
jgi:spore germination protein